MSKTLMSYPRPYYVLVIFYILISALLPDILFFFIAGEYGDFQKLYGNMKKKWKPSSSVATFQRQRHNIWSTE